jgi:hypothetical protein
VDGAVLYATKADEIAPGSARNNHFAHQRLTRQRTCSDVVAIATRSLHVARGRRRFVAMWLW